MTSVHRATTKTVIVADDTAFVRDRFATALEGAGHKALTVKSAAELLARVRADLAQIDLIVLDLRLPHAAGVELVRSIRKLDDGRLPILVFSGTIASADEVRELAALGVAGYVNEYSAVQHILPSLAPHLFPDNFNRRGSPRVVLGIPVAYRFGNTIAAALTLNLSKGGIAIRTMSPLEQRRQGARPLPPARIEARHRGGVARRVERSPRRHGAAVRKGRSGRSGRDRRVRRPAFLHEPEGRERPGFTAHEVRLLLVPVTRQLEPRLFPQQPQRVRDHDERRAHVGDDRHPQRRDPSDGQHQERAPSARSRTRCSRGCCATVARLRRSA